MSAYTTGTGQTLTRIHEPGTCIGERCVIHNPRPLPDGWLTHWRVDRGIMEVLCPEHRVGHPHPDSPWPDDSYQWVHGCCGCCTILKEG